MKNLIVIEDDCTIRNNIIFFFKELSFNVIGCSNGEEYLDNHKFKKYDLAIIDLVLPGISGVRLIQHFPRNQKIIITSGYMPSILGNEFFNTEYIIFLQKPFSLNQLHSLVNKMIF